MSLLCDELFRVKPEAVWDIFKWPAMQLCRCTHSNVKVSVPSVRTDESWWYLWGFFTYYCSTFLWILNLLKIKLVMGNRFIKFQVLDAIFKYSDWGSLGESYDSEFFNFPLFCCTKLGTIKLIQLYTFLCTHFTDWKHWGSRRVTSLRSPSGLAVTLGLERGFLFHHESFNSTSWECVWYREQRWGGGNPELMASE